MHGANCNRIQQLADETVLCYHARQCTDRLHEPLPRMLFVFLDFCSTTLWSVNNMSKYATLNKKFGARTIREHAAQQERDVGD